MPPTTSRPPRPMTIQTQMGAPDCVGGAGAGAAATTGGCICGGGCVTGGVCGGFASATCTGGGSFFVMGGSGLVSTTLGGSTFVSTFGGGGAGINLETLSFSFFGLKVRYADRSFA